MRGALALAAAALLTLLAAPLAEAGGRSRLQTPGYRGVTRAPPLLPQQPPSPIALGAGERPQLLVDAAGTAHVVWNESRGAGADEITHYCRLKRGTRACDARHQLSIPGAGRAFDAPRVVALGDEVGVLTQRSQNVTAPDGSTTSSPVFLFLSQDGGTTFNPPALVGNGPLSGRPAVFGAPDAPRVGLVSHLETGGAFFQVLTPGRYEGRRPSFGGDGIDSAFGSVNGAPIVAFNDLGGTVHLKTWSGQGEVHDPGTWASATLPGAAQPRLASGPAGAFLMHARGSPREYVVRKVTPPSTFGPPVRVDDTRSASDPLLHQDAGGRLLAGFVDGDGDTERLVVRSSADGRRWDARRVLLASTRDTEVWAADVAAAFDGGGFAVGQIAAGGAAGPIVAAPTGNRFPTGRPGLGSLAGSPEPGVVERCQRIEFAAVDIETPEGCLLSAANQKGVKVSEGTVKLNGLELVPDPGVKILFNARARTIDSTGNVTVQMRAPNVDPVVLARDVLHLQLPAGSAVGGVGACRGQPLVAFDAGRAVLKGFPIRGSIEIYLGEDSTCIPVSLELPKAFGGIRGDAILRASNQRGLHVESLDIRANTIPIGPMLIQDLRVTYQAAGDRWTGGARLTFPPGWTMGATVVFKDGEFRGAQITLGFFPGVPVFAGVFLNRVTAGVEVDPLKLTAGARFGVFPIAPPDNFAIDVTGRLEATFGDPFTLRINGDVAVFGFRLLAAEAVIRSDLYFNVRARLTLDIKVVSVRGDVELFVDGPNEEFGGSVGATVSILGAPAGSAEAVLSSRALGVCGPSPIPFVDAGFVVVWREGTKFLWGDCDLEPYKVSSGPPGGRAAQAGAALEVPAGAPSASLRVTGRGGVPSVVLVSPTGERIAPAREGGRGVPAIRLDDPAENAVYVALPSPRAGAWRVEPAPGSPPIERVESALAKPDPRVTGSLARPRKGARAQTLRWRFPNAQGRIITFVEKSAAGARTIGAGRGTGGTLRFDPGEGPAGPRTVFAVVEQAGTPRRETRLAAYRSPGPVKPGRVPRATLRRRGGAVTVTWPAAPGAASYVVRADVSDGRRTAFTTRGRSLRIPAIAKGDRISVRVQARGRNGRLGPAARARG